MSNTQVATTKKNTVVEQVTAKVQAFQQNGEIHFPLPTRLRTLLNQLILCRKIQKQANKMVIDQFLKRARKRVLPILCLIWLFKA